MKRSIHVERVYAHPPALVWRALTEPALLAGWLMENDFQAREGHRFQLKTDPAPGFNGIVDCQVLELDAPHRMAWSWKGGAIDTVITFHVEAHPRGTRLRVDHEGFEGVAGVLTSFILGAGNRGVYGRRFPAFLDALAASQGEHGEHGCPEKQGTWWWIAQLAAPLLRRRAGTRADRVP